MLFSYPKLTLLVNIDVTIKNCEKQLASDMLKKPELIELFPVSVSTKLVKSAGEDLHELLLDHPTKELEFKESELYGALTPEGE